MLDLAADGEPVGYDIQHASTKRELVAWLVLEEPEDFGRMKQIPRPGRTFWSVPIEDCDVESKDALRLYRRKRAEWLDWLCGEDDHSVISQIHLMSWNYVVWRIINESRRLAMEKPRSSPALSRMLGGFIDNGFVATQALAIRRLMEEAAKNPDKQVISLHRLVFDLKENQKLFTREIFVGFDGLPFDPEPARLRWVEQTRRSLKKTGGFAYWVEEYPPAGPREAWEHAKRLHEIFDRMAGRKAVNPDRQDILPEWIFKALEKKLGEPDIKKAQSICNKYIAHAADLFSRSRADQDLNSGMTLREFDSAHRAIITVAEFIAVSLLGETISNPVPHPIFNQFEYLEAGWIEPSDIGALDECWRQLSDERERWRREAVDHILACRPSK